MASEASTSSLPNFVLLQLLDEAPDAIILVDESGRLRFANRQAEDMFGYQRGELLDLPLEQLLPASLRAAHVAHRGRYMHGPGVRPMGRGFELSAQSKAGRQFAVEVSLSPIVTDQGQFVASSIRDIGERKHSEAEARLTSERLLSAVGSIQSGFALFDADDRLVLCNEDFRQLFSDAPGALVGRSFVGLLADNRQRFAHSTHPDAGQRWLAYHRNPAGTLDLRMRDASTWRLTERRTAEGGRVMTLWDISADVERERELEQAHALAEAANAAKTDFLASMSHELRTPLNAILGFAQLAARDKLEPPTPRQRARLEQVVRGGEHLLRLIDDVLDLARIEAGRLSVSLGTVGADRVMREASHAIEQMAANRGVQLNVESSAGCVLRADPTRLKQVLINFGTNAIKYGRMRGRATFRAERRAGGLVRLIVEDDGPGVPLHQQDKLFQPFCRAGQELGSVEGTGIGLALCKRLAEAMEGGVGFVSVPGQGSSFWIELPLARDTVPADTQLEHLEPAQSAITKHKLLYVEDDPSNVALMRDLMRDSERVELLVAASAEAGIETAREQRPCLIIMDINLPGASGIEAALALKRFPETRQIPIIALSASTMTRESEREKLFHRYLSKPVKLDVLLETIEPLLPA